MNEVALQCNIDIRCEMELHNRKKYFNIIENLCGFPFTDERRIIEEKKL